MSDEWGGTHEYELKFDVTDEQLSRLRNKSILKRLGIAEATSRQLRSVYFDTPQRELKANGITLRLRKIGNRWVQTIKAGRGVIAGLSNPIEFEHPVAKQVLELNQIDKSGIPEAFKKLLRNAVVEPVFETIISRTTNHIRTKDGSHLEVAFDSWAIEAGNSRRQFHEVEIELKSGDPASLYGFAEKMLRNECLRFSSLTKAERGYDTVDGIARGPRVAQRYTQPKLAKRCEAKEAFQTITRACAEQISHNWQVVLDGPDIGGPHQMRVGLRRLRSTLRAFRHVQRGKGLTRIEADARDIAAVVGELRDIDVLATQIVPAVAAALPNEASLAQLQAELNRLQSDVRSNVTVRLSGGRIMSFLLRLGRLTEAPKWRKAGKALPATAIASRALEDSWRRANKWGKNIGDLSVPDRHSMRKVLKKLRYQAEAFADFYPDSKTKPFIRKLKKIQNVFGYLNDVAMAEKLSDLALAHADNADKIGNAIEIVLAWHTQRSDHEWRKAKRAWRSLEQTGEFWVT